MSLSAAQDIYKEFIRPSRYATIPGPTKKRGSEKKVSRKRRPLRRASSLILLAILTSSCAGLPWPSVYTYPSRGQMPDQISQDRAECMLWAKDVTGFDPVASGVTGTILGGLGGAALGALGGLIFGEASKGAAIGALGGGVGGGMYNYSKDKEGYERAYAACMQGRGYSVR